MAGENDAAQNAAVQNPTDDLASRIAEGASFSEIDEGNQSVGDIDRGGETQQPPAQQTSELAKIREELDAERAERRMERQTILGLLAKQKQAPVVIERTQEPTPPPAPPQPTEEQLLESLKKDPLGTIKNIAADVASRTAKQVREELSGQITSRTQATEANIRRQDALRQAAVEVKNEFADIYNDPKLSEAFDLEAGQEIFRMYGDDWAKHMSPADPMNAASRVYARWARSGKLAQTQAHANGGTNGGDAGGSRTPSLREIVRSAPTGGSSDRVAGTAGAPRGDGRRTPTTLAELGYTQTEQVAARKVMKDYGMTEAQWVANYLAASQDDPNFGRG